MREHVLMLALGPRLAHRPGRLAELRTWAFAYVLPATPTEFQTSLGVRLPGAEVVVQWATQFQAAGGGLVAVNETLAGEGSDEAILQESLARPAAFSELFSLHGDRLHAYFTRRAGRFAADDLSSELWLRAFRKRSTFDPCRGTVLGWIYGIARNLVRHHYRDVGRRREVNSEMVDAGAFAAEIDLADRVADRVSAESAMQRARAAYAGLSDREREILELFIWDELSYREISQTLAIPLGTVRSRLARARQRLSVSADLDAYR